MPRRERLVTPAYRNVSSWRVPLFIPFGGLTVALMLFGSSGTAHARTLRVAVVTDGPTTRQLLPADLIQSEAARIGNGDLRIELPGDKRFAGDGSQRGAAAALTRALDDVQVDVVLTLGVLASEEAAQRLTLQKPVIAAAVIDPVLQRFPLKAGKSGRANFNYVADFQGIESNVRTFHQVVGIKHLVVLIDATLLEALPTLRTKADELALALNIRITLVAAGDAVAPMLAAIPADANAVIVTPLRLDERRRRELFTELNAHRLPTFSAAGRADLELGLLMTTGGSHAESTRLARRLVLSIQRIAGGEPAANLEVGFVAERRLVINMQTAQAIGFSPRWQDLTDAEQVFAELSAPPSLTFVDALRAAVANNPALAASRARLESSDDDVRIARSSLLPSLDSSVSNTRIDADRANPLTQAEQSTAATLALQATLYSERAWANYSISRSLNEANRYSTERDVMDTLADSAGDYLDVLRAKSVESVRRDNVENTRKNLETSRVREAVGLAEHSDYLRWVSQLARDRQQLLAAEANRRQAEVELARVIHRPAAEPFQTVDASLDEQLNFVSSARARAFFDTPMKWATFSDFAVAAAVDHAPEIAQAEAVISGRRRAVTAARRSYFLPDLALVSKGSRTLDRSGVGSSVISGAPDDESWSVSLQATFAIFTGGQRRAELSQSRHELRAAESDRDTAADAVEARARAALQRAASSYPSIELADTAAGAARENLAMVSDAYARGAVTVTELIDAQDAALNSGLAAADAKYSFLADFVAMLRALNELEILLDPYAREAWMQQVDQWFREHPSTTR